MVGSLRAPLGIAAPRTEPCRAQQGAGDGADRDPYWTHKTGTKSLQSFLWKQRAALAARDILVPNKHCGHHNLVWHLWGWPRFGTIDTLLAELAAKRPRRAILSSEWFSLLLQKPAALARFEDALTGAWHSLEYVVVLRRADDYAQSLYPQLVPQLVSHGLTGSFRRFALEVLLKGRFVLHNERIFRFDHAAVVRDWRARAQGPLTVIGYDAAAAAQAPRRKSAPIPPLDRRVAAWLLRRRFPPRRIDALAGADDLDAGRAVLPRP